MVRVAGVHRKLDAEINILTKEGLTNLEQLNAIRKKTSRFLVEQVDVLHQLIDELKQEIDSDLNEENQLNEVTNRQIIQFVQAIDPEGQQNTRVYFNNPGSYTIDGAIDYLDSHSSLYNDNPDGGLSGFTKSDLIQYAQEAGWDQESIDYMLGLSPVKFLERG
jgi:hypothetical protein